MRMCICIFFCVFVFAQIDMRVLHVYFAFKGTEFAHPYMHTDGRIHKNRDQLHIQMQMYTSRHMYTSRSRASSWCIQKNNQNAKGSTYTYIHIYTYLVFKGTECAHLKNPQSAKGSMYTYTYIYIYIFIHTSRSRASSSRICHGYVHVRAPTISDTAPPPPPPARARGCDSAYSAVYVWRCVLAGGFFCE